MEAFSTSKRVKTDKIIEIKSFISLKPAATGVNFCQSFFGFYWNFQAFSEFPGIPLRPIISSLIFSLPNNLKSAEDFPVCDCLNQWLWLKVETQLID